VAIGLAILVVLVKIKTSYRSPAALAAARDALARGGRLVDVRSVPEYRGGHARGAINVPVGEVVAGQHGQLGPKDGAVLLYCRSGARSAMAASALRRAGYRDVHDLGPLANAHKVAG